MEEELQIRANVCMGWGYLEENLGAGQRTLKFVGESEKVVVKGSRVGFEVTAKKLKQKNLMGTFGLGQTVITNGQFLSLLIHSSHLGTSRTQE